MTTLKDASAQLESFVVKQLLTSSGAFKGSGAAGSGLVNELFAEQLADVIARTSNLNLMGGARTHGAQGSDAAIAHPHEAHARGDAPHVSSQFGPRADPLTGKPQFHGGVDLPAPAGTPFPAARVGTVIAAGERGGYGLAVEVAHPDGSSTLYAHAQRVSVEVGQHVQAGEALGEIGQTGRSTGPHLHLELRRGGRPVNPEAALKSYRLRADVPHGEKP